jgi:hypothetical protein
LTRSEPVDGIKLIDCFNLTIVGTTIVHIEKNLCFIINIKSSSSLNIPKWKSKQTNTFGYLVGKKYSYDYTSFLDSNNMLLPQLRNILASFNQGWPNME